MHSAIHAVQDGIGAVVPLVAQPPVDDPSRDRRQELCVRHGDLAGAAAQGLVHCPQDIPSLAQKRRPGCEFRRDLHRFMSSRSAGLPPRQLAQVQREV
jgi:hypothetical protein